MREKRESESILFLDMHVHWCVRDSEKRERDFTVLVRDSIHEVIVSLSMPEVWLRLHDIPKKHRRVDRLMEGLKMLGRPIVVDEIFLTRLGLVRMKFGCKAPDKMNGFVQVWFNHEGYDIKVEVERLPKHPGDGPAAPGPNDAPPRPSGKRGGPSGSGTGGLQTQKQGDHGGLGGQSALPNGQAMDVVMACRD